MESNEPFCTMVTATKRIIGITNRMTMPPISRQSRSSSFLMDMPNLNIPQPLSCYVDKHIFKVSRFVGLGNKLFRCAFLPQLPRLDNAHTGTKRLSFGQMV